ncbi:hypothetical protein ACF0H5_021621 [Mactra antiquata]
MLCTMTKLSRKHLLAGLILIVAVTVTQGTFKVNVDDTGGFTISVDGVTWLSSGKPFFNKNGQRWSVGGINGSQLVQVNITSHVHVGGQKWNETKVLYTFGNGGDMIATYIRIYDEEYNRIIFTQEYIAGASNTSINGQTSFNTTIGGYPCLQITDPDEDLGFLSYGGYMLGFTDMTTGIFNHQTTTINDGMNYGPLALFNKKGKAVVISPYDNYMSASLWQDLNRRQLVWGIMGGVNDIPANFTYRTILQYGDSINQAFSEWGKTLQGKVGLDKNIQRTKNLVKDITVNNLGYWTDNGAYYYYTTQPDKSYETTLADVKSYADQQQIPYRYLQLDSWWYPKENNSRGVLTWTALPDVFPSGLQNLSATTGWKFLAHNRYWSKLTPYAKQNNGSFNFIVENGGSLPIDLEFWRYLFKQAKSWGLIVYEQDWLNRQTMYLSSLHTSLTLGTQWLTQMGQAAQENGLTIQYCMAMSRHALQSIEIPAVTQARVSDDFLFKAREQWRIGETSIFANAINVRPYKDTFWTTSVQPQNRYGKESKYPGLESVVSSLTRGPVGPGDKIGYTNKTLLMRCCRQDGLLLRPSRPALATDKQLMMKAFGQSPNVEIWTTNSRISTGYGYTVEYGILFAADVPDHVTISVTELHFDLLTSGIYYPYNDITRWQYFNSTTIIDLSGCSKTDFCLFYFSPWIQGSNIQAILGESNKWIPVSSDRITEITSTQDSTTLSLSGVPGEIVTIFYVFNDQLQSTPCSFTFNTTSCVLAPKQNSATSVKSENFRTTVTLLTIIALRLIFLK